MSENNEIKNIIDAYGNSYNVVKKVGEGSQGSTYLLQGGTHIAKLFKKTINMNPTALKSKINFLIQLGLDKKKFSTPLREIVQPMTGYISEFATAMQPLSTLMIESMPEDEDNSEWFKRTGGLLKRYGVLIRLANEIRLLHAKGLIYCDLSDNNVFVSNAPEKVNVFLIDLDNIRYKTSIIHNIYTPGYGAPEVVKGIAPNTPNSDAFSFAVLAYKLLTWAHPLIGDVVNDGDPELEEKAFRGELPWCEDEQDTSNERTGYGLPSNVFVTDKLRRLFKKTFEEGLNEPMRRPSMGAWVDALNESLNELLLCPNCGIHYPNKSIGHCPFCEHEPENVLRFSIQRWDKDIQYDRETNSTHEFFTLSDFIYDEIIVDSHTSKSIKAYHLNLTDEDHVESVISQVTMSVDGEYAKLLLNVRDGIKLYYCYADGDPEQCGVLDKPKTIKIPLKRNRKVMMGTKPFNVDQQVIIF